jgi:hypothetical protein
MSFEKVIPDRRGGRKKLAISIGYSQLFFSKGMRKLIEERGLKFVEIFNNNDERKLLLEISKVSNKDSFDIRFYETVTVVYVGNLLSDINWIRNERNSQTESRRSVRFTLTELGSKDENTWKFCTEDR